MHQSTRSKATTDDVQVHSSEATTDIVNLATDLVTAYTGGFDCDFLRRGFWCCTIVMEMVMVIMVEKVTMMTKKPDSKYREWVGKEQQQVMDDGFDA